jgi:hypothetical protein
VCAGLGCVALRHYTHTHTHTHTHRAYISVYISIYVYIYIYGTTNNGTDAKKKSVYTEERYEPNQEEILKYRRERDRTMHKKDLNIKVSTGTFTLYFD